MTNADKYLKEGITPAIFCKACTTGTINVCALAEWLRKEAKPTLTEDEKVILRNIFKGFDKIRRTSIQDGRHLEVYCIFNKIWYEFMYQHLFQFIQPGEEYKISDLLEE